MADSIKTLHLLLLFFTCNCMKNACKDYEDYATMATNPHCWHNSDVGATPSQLAANHGYQMESYEIFTDDGYILSLFRIPTNNSNFGRQPVILQHGFAGDAAKWMIHGQESPVKKGFDVWLTNSRGSDYSLKHVKYTTADQQFWDFSFHEIALHDLPKIIEFVAEMTKQPGNISYIGHSMGCTMSFVYASIMPGHAEKYLKGIISLAPVAFADHASALLKALAPFLQFAPSLMGLGELAPEIRNFFRRFCTDVSSAISLCKTLITTFGGFDVNEVEPEYLQTVLSHYPSSFSFKTVMHFGQILTARQEFRFFNYGREQNWKLYKQAVPPEYDLSKITVPVHLFYGKKDIFLGEEDVALLFERLKTRKSMMAVIEGKDFGHVDYQVGNNIEPFYTLLVPYIQGTWNVS